MTTETTTCDRDGCAVILNDGQPPDWCNCIQAGDDQVSVLDDLRHYVLALGSMVEVGAPNGYVLDRHVREALRSDETRAQVIAIEREPDYLPLIEQRIARRTNPVTHHKLTRADDDAPSLFDLMGDA